MEAWFRQRGDAPRETHKQRIKSASKADDLSENLGDKTEQERAPVLGEMSLPSDWFSHRHDPDERLEALQKAIEMKELPCFFALFSNGKFYFAESWKSLVQKISKGSRHAISTFERKERFLTCAYRCEKMPMKTIEELRQALESASKQFEEKEKFASNRYPSDTKLRAFQMLFRGIIVTSIYDSIELPRKPPKYVFEKKEGIDSVKAHTPIPSKLCNGCRRSLHECRCDLINGYNRT